MSEPRKILIRGTNWIGDAVLSTSALTLLGQAYPQASIAVVARPWVADVYARHPAVDRVILYEGGGYPARGARLVRLIRQVRRESFDTAILFQNAFEAAFIAWTAGIPRRVGYVTDGRAWLLTDPVEFGAVEEKHQRHYYTGPLRALGIRGDTPDPIFPVSDGAREWAEDLIAATASPSGPLVGLHVGASFGEAKRWPAERFTQLIQRLTDPLGAAVLIVGGEEDARVARELTQGIDPPPTIVAGQGNLEQQAAVMARCAVFITNDSGPMHVAAAVGTPVVAIFGPTDAGATGPVGESHVVLQEPVDCAPCNFRTCPIDHRCMTRISVDAITAAVQGVLDSPRP